MCVSAKHSTETERVLQILYWAKQSKNLIRDYSSLDLTGHMDYLKQSLLQMHKLNVSPKKLRCKTPSIPDPL